MLVEYLNTRMFQIIAREDCHNQIEEAHFHSNGATQNAANVWRATLDQVLEENGALTKKL